MINISTLSMNDVKEVVSFISGTKYNKKETMKNLILFSVDTAACLQECLTLKWSDFQVYDDHVDVNFKNRIAKISVKFYNQLSVLRNKNSDRVFDISNHSVNVMMTAIREYLDPLNSRNITFHSFKKAGVSFTRKILASTKF
ncbi:hypothetical protein [Siminovitchia sp. 179-K 8D1 HS]|uniref:hypothetical protein n=1 Tax=Siminovitchia sp. 179-K 8D1 HS TaxID=3142385 RepID=UPI0039A0AAD7